MYTRTLVFPTEQKNLRLGDAVDVNTPLTWARTTHDTLKGWFADGPLTGVTADTGAVVEVRTNRELPPLDATIEFAAFFICTTHELVGRLMPERASGSTAGPSVEAFADHPFATELFLTRYMPFSRARAQHAAGHSALLIECIRNHAGILMATGFIDGQGLRQALCDFPDGISHASALQYTRNTPLWFDQFEKQVHAISTKCLEQDKHHVVPTDETAGVLVAMTKLIAGVEPDGETVRMWTYAKNYTLSYVTAFYEANGRVGGKTSNFAIALLQNDLLVWFADDNDKIELAGMNVAGWITRPRMLGLAASMLASAVARKMATCTPIVVLENVNEWPEYVLAATLAALMHAAPRSQSSPGIFTATGSAAPIKLVLLSSSADFARQKQFAPFAAQYKSV
jgi:hypothetical protein